MKTESPMRSLAIRISVLKVVPATRVKLWMPLVFKKVVFIALLGLAKTRVLNNNLESSI
jgi:hypothetical protein